MRLLFPIALALALVVTSCASGKERSPNRELLQTDQMIFLGNEGILAQHGSIKVLFDAFFANPLAPEVNVSEQMRMAVFESKPPFDSVSVVFVSHLHGDHYNGPDLIRYLADHPDVQLVAPEQVVQRLQETEKPSKDILMRIVSITAKAGEAPQVLSIGMVQIEAFHVQHVPIGRPMGRMDNIIFRVQLGDGVTVMHLGDAELDPKFYMNQSVAWQRVRSDIAFAPFWFIVSEDDEPTIDIRQQLNVARVVGFHAWNSTLKDIDREGKREQFILQSGEAIDVRLSKQ